MALFVFLILPHISVLPIPLTKTPRIFLSRLKPLPNEHNVKYTDI